MAEVKKRRRRGESGDGKPAGAQALGIMPAVRGQRRLHPGQQIGFFTIVAEAGGEGALTWAWLTRCVCGSEKVRLENRLIYSGARSCGCRAAARTSEGRLAEARAEVIGKTFGWLTVEEVLPADERSNRNYRFVARCKCGSPERKTGQIVHLHSGWVSTCCHPRPFSAESDALHMDVLRQLADGAGHYSPRHRLVRRLIEEGLVDEQAMRPTTAGVLVLASGRIGDVGKMRTNGRTGEVLVSCEAGKLAGVAM